MYLILPTPQAEQRNHMEAVKRSCGMVTQYWWAMIANTTGDLTALDVADGDGLTDEEMAACVDKLPADFLPEEPETTEI